MSTKKKLIFLFAFLIFQNGYAQRPIITSVDKTSGAFSEVVTINGSDFGTNASNLRVFFGSSVGTIKSVSNQVIEVLVPAGATYETISVVNVTNGLTGYSNTQFGISFGGANGISTANFGPEFLRQSESGLYDLCSCDFNNDSKIDIATASDNSTSLAIFPSGSTIGSLNFTQVKILLNAKTLHITCGDLNGDGRPDIVASEANGGLSRVFILRNNGNFTTWGIQAVTLTGKKVKRVAIADLDQDGKPEVVITDTGSNNISILPNRSTTSSIIFGPTITLPVLSLALVKSTDALEVKDLNGDGNPEIITSQFGENNSNIFICLNKSSPGNFNLSEVTTLLIGNSIVNVRVGDLDGDNKPDIAATRLLGSDVVVFRNTSTTQLSFAPTPVSFKTNIRPWGLDFGDLDGDGKTDIVVGSIDPITKSVSILSNTSTPGNFSFATYVPLSSTFINRNIKIGDLDGDGKPDIGFTSIDDNNLGVPASRVSIFRNRSCFIPKLNPPGPLTICVGSPLKLTATGNPDAQYSWANEATTVTGSTAELAITASGKYTATATSEAGTCVKTSNVVDVVFSNGPAFTATPAATSNSPICTNDKLQLTINDVGATEYRWTGPNSFTATGRTPSLSNFTIANAGKYSVDIVTGGCVAKTEIVSVEVINIPTFTLNFSGDNTICKGTTKVISIAPVLPSGFSYQWLEKTAGAVAGQTNPTFTATSSGEYFARITPPSAGCSPKETPSTTITVLALPVPEFTSTPAIVCNGTTVTFSNQSTTDPKAVTPRIPTYSWTFGDGGTSNLQNPTNIYSTTQTTPQSLKIFLTVDYTGLSGCAKTIEKSISVLPAVKPEISSPTPSFCKGDTKTLTIAGDFTSITWSTGKTGPTITTTQAGTFNATTVDKNGCSAKGEFILVQSPNPTLVLTAEKTAVQLGESTQLTASGAFTYAWNPVETLDDPLIFNPIAKPIAPTVYKVLGTSKEGCIAKDSIAIDVAADVANLPVPSVFTPNGDGKNDTWIIPGIELYPDCTLSLFDKNGSKILEQKGYKNDWDGTYNGSPVPDGIYYYLFYCGDKQETGNVIVAR